MSDLEAISTPLAINPDSPLSSHHSSLSGVELATIMPPDTSPSATPPVLGGIHNKTIWIGGPPKEDFSCPALLIPPTPLCYRNLETSYEVKGFSKRTAGSEVKFKRDHPEFNLISLADEALQHMQQCGMDTVFYMTGEATHGTGA